MVYWAHLPPDNPTNLRTGKENKLVNLVTEDMAGGTCLSHINITSRNRGSFSLPPPFLFVTVPYATISAASVWYRSPIAISAKDWENHSPLSWGWQQNWQDNKRESIIWPSFVHCWRNTRLTAPGLLSTRFSFLWATLSEFFTAPNTKLTKKVIQDKTLPRKVIYSLQYRTTGGDMADGQE